MPCGDKWKNKTMKRIPLGIGHGGGGACCGSCSHGHECESACHDHGARPTPWWRRAGHCCEPCAYGHPKAPDCACQRGIAGKKKNGRRRQRKLPALIKAPRGMGASNACGGGCSTALGANPNETGCATGVWPDPRGEFFGFQHGSGRRVPVRLYNEMMPRRALPGDCYGPESCW